MLLAAGFKESGGKILEPNGKPFSVTFTGPTPYTDFMSDMQLMSTALNGIGVSSSVNGVGLSAWTTAYTDGTYQATMCGTFQTPGPFQLYNLELNGSLSAPVGKPAVGDYERWMDPATNAALNSYADTQSASVQQADLDQVEKIMVNEMPLIPLMGLTSYAEYRTTHATGWVTASNQYQMPNPSSPWDETVVLHRSRVRNPKQKGVMGGATRGSSFRDLEGRDRGLRKYLRALRERPRAVPPA